MLQFMGLQRVGHNLATEQQQKKQEENLEEYTLEDEVHWLSPHLLLSYKFIWDTSFSRQIFLLNPLVFSKKNLLTPKNSLEIISLDWKIWGEKVLFGTPLFYNDCALMCFLL